MLCVGEILVDLIAPDTTNIAAASTFQRRAGGAPANVAVAVARLNARSAFVGAVGTDPFGDYLAARLHAERVNVSALSRVAEPTSLAFVASNQGGIPDFLFYRGADSLLCAQDIPLSLVVGARFLYLSSMALQSEPSASATLYAADLARQHGCLVCVDPNLRPSSWSSLDAMRGAVSPLLDTAEILKVNELEARLLGDAEPMEAARRLARGGRLVLVTLGPDGCLWYRGAEHGRVPAPAVTVADTTGAGDAFMGAFLARWARILPASARPDSVDVNLITAAARYAVAAASLSCTCVGAMDSLPSDAQLTSTFPSAT